MKRVLVTGSNGQLGKTLQELASHYSEIEFFFTDKATLDISTAEQVHKCFEKFEPAYCINCAAYTQVDQAEQSPKLAHEVNVDGVEFLVRACKRFNTVLIHLSTDYVFDGTKEEGYYPEDAPNPINVYGRTKLAGENVIQKNMDQFFIVRTSWLYSKKYGHNFYKTILTKAKAGEFLTVTDQQRGCPTDTKTLAKYLLNLVTSENTDYGIKHFTDGEAMTWYEFARRILYDNEIPVEGRLTKGTRESKGANRPRNSILKM